MAYSNRTTRTKTKREEEQDFTVKQPRKRGRPVGSKNKNHRDIKLNPQLTQIQNMLKRVLELIKGTTNIGYFMYDGAFNL